jgi:hypothetical protein
LCIGGLIKDYVASKDQMIIENEWKRIWKEVALVYFKVVFFSNWPGRAEENRRMTSLSRPRFE